jgi:hypothetical protein
MSRNHLTKVGITVGLVNPSTDDQPEQLAVYQDSHNEDRPIRLETMTGYKIPHKLSLTRKQAAQLAGVLIEALVICDRPHVADFSIRMSD